jgi:hypothetical protein
MSDSHPFLGEIQRLMQAKSGGEDLTLQQVNLTPGIGDLITLELRKGDNIPLVDFQLRADPKFGTLFFQPAGGALQKVRTDPGVSQTQRVADLLHALGTRALAQGAGQPGWNPARASSFLQNEVGYIGGSYLDIRSEQNAAMRARVASERNFPRPNDEDEEQLQLGPFGQLQHAAPRIGARPGGLLAGIRDWTSHLYARQADAKYGGQIEPVYSQLQGGASRWNAQTGQMEILSWRSSNDGIKIVKHAQKAGLQDVARWTDPVTHDLIAPVRPSLFSHYGPAGGDDDSRFVRSRDSGQVVRVAFGAGLPEGQGVYFQDWDIRQQRTMQVQGRRLMLKEDLKDAVSVESDLGPGGQTGYYHGRGRAMEAFGASTGDWDLAHARMTEMQVSTTFRRDLAQVPVDLYASAAGSSVIGSWGTKAMLHQGQRDYYSAPSRAQILMNFNSIKDQLAWSESLVSGVVYDWADKGTPVRQGLKRLGIRSLDFGQSAEAVLAAARQIMAMPDYWEGDKFIAPMLMTPSRSGAYSWGGSKGGTPGMGAEDVLRLRRAAPEWYKQLQATHGLSKKDVFGEFIRTGIVMYHRMTGDASADPTAPGRGGLGHPFKVGAYEKAGLRAEVFTGAEEAGRPDYERLLTALGEVVGDRDKDPLELGLTHKGKNITLRMQSLRNLRFLTGQNWSQPAGQDTREDAPESLWTNHTTSQMRILYHALAGKAPLEEDVDAYLSSSQQMALSRNIHKSMLSREIAGAAGGPIFGFDARKAPRLEYALVASDESLRKFARKRPEEWTPEHLEAMYDMLHAEAVPIAAFRYPHASEKQMGLFLELQPLHGHEHEVGISRSPHRFGLSTTVQSLFEGDQDLDPDWAAIPQDTAEDPLRWYRDDTGKLAVTYVGGYRPSGGKDMRSRIAAMAQVKLGTEEESKWRKEMGEFDTRAKAEAWLSSKLSVKPQWIAPAGLQQSGYERTLTFKGLMGRMYNWSRQTNFMTDMQEKFARPLIRLYQNMLDATMPGQAARNAMQLQGTLQPSTTGFGPFEGTSFGSFGGMRDAAMAATIGNLFGAAELPDKKFLVKLLNPARENFRDIVRALKEGKPNWAVQMALGEHSFEEAGRSPMTAAVRSDWTRRWKLQNREGYIEGEEMGQQDYPWHRLGSAVHNLISVVSGKHKTIPEMVSHYEGAATTRAQSEYLNPIMGLTGLAAPESMNDLKDEAGISFGESWSSRLGSRFQAWNNSMTGGATGDVRTDRMFNGVADRVGGVLGGLLGKLPFETQKKVMRYGIGALAGGLGALGLDQAKWLSHYLLGKGQPMRIPGKYGPALASSIAGTLEDLYTPDRLTGKVLSDASQGSPAEVGWSEAFNFTAGHKMGSDPQSLKLHQMIGAAYAHQGSGGVTEVRDWYDWHASFHNKDFKDPQELLQDMPRELAPLMRVAQHIPLLNYSLEQGPFENVAVKDNLWNLLGGTPFMTVGQVPTENIRQLLPERSRRHFPSFGEGWARTANREFGANISWGEASVLEGLRQMPKYEARQIAGAISRSPRYTPAGGTGAPSFQSDWDAPVTPPGGFRTPPRVNTPEWLATLSAEEQQAWRAAMDPGHPDAWTFTGLAPDQRLRILRRLGGRYSDVGEPTPHEISILRASARPPVGTPIAAGGGGSLAGGGGGGGGGTATPDAPFGMDPEDGGRRRMPASEERIAEHLGRMLHEANVGRKLAHRSRTLALSPERAQQLARFVAPGRWMSTEAQKFLASDAGEFVGSNHPLTQAMEQLEQFESGHSQRLGVGTLRRQASIIAEFMETQAPKVSGAEQGYYLQAAARARAMEAAVKGPEKAWRGHAVDALIPGHGESAPGAGDAVGPSYAFTTASVAEESRLPPEISALQQQAYALAGSTTNRRVASMANTAAKQFGRLGNMTSGTDAYQAHLNQANLGLQQARELSMPASLGAGLWDTLAERVTTVSTRLNEMQANGAKLNDVQKEQIKFAKEFEKATTAVEKATKQLGELAPLPSDTPEMARAKGIQRGEVQAEIRKGQELRSELATAAETGLAPHASFELRMARRLANLPGVDFEMAQALEDRSPAGRQWRMIRQAGGLQNLTQLPGMVINPAIQAMEVAGQRDVMLARTAALGGVVGAPTPAMLSMARMGILQQRQAGQMGATWGFAAELASQANASALTSMAAPTLGVGLGTYAALAGAFPEFAIPGAFLAGGLTGAFAIGSRAQYLGQPGSQAQTGYENVSGFRSALSSFGLLGGAVSAGMTGFANVMPSLMGAMVKAGPFGSSLSTLGGVYNQVQNQTNIGMAIDDAVKRGLTTKDLDRLERQFGPAARQTAMSAAFDQLKTQNGFTDEQASSALTGFLRLGGAVGTATPQAFASKFMSYIQAGVDVTQLTGQYQRAYGGNFAAAATRMTGDIQKDQLALQFLSGQAGQAAVGLGIAPSSTQAAAWAQLPGQISARMDRGMGRAYQIQNQEQVLGMQPGRYAPNTATLQALYAAGQGVTADLWQSITGVGAQQSFNTYAQVANQVGGLQAARQAEAFRNLGQAAPGIGNFQVGLMQAAQQGPGNQLSYLVASGQAAGLNLRAFSLPGGVNYLRTIQTGGIAGMQGLGIGTTSLFDPSGLVAAQYAPILGATAQGGAGYALRAALGGGGIQNAIQAAGYGRDVVRGGLWGLQDAASNLQYGTSLAQLGLQSAQLQFGWAMQSGAGLGGAMAGYPGMQGGPRALQSQWAIQDQQIALARAQQQWGLTYGQAQINLGTRQFGQTQAFNIMAAGIGYGQQQVGFELQGQQLQLGRQYQLQQFGFQAEQLGTQRRFQLQNFALEREGQLLGRTQFGQTQAFQQQAANIGYAFQMRDIDIAIRRSTGFERQQLVRQKEEETSAYNIDTEGRKLQAKQAKEQWSLEDRRFAVQKSQATLMFDLDKRRFDAEKAHADAAFALEQKQFEVAQQNAKVNYDLELKRFDLEAKQFKERTSLEQANHDKQVEWFATQVALEDANRDNQRTLATFQHTMDTQRLALSGNELKNMKDISDLQTAIERANLLQQSQIKFLWDTSWDWAQSMSKWLTQLAEQTTGGSGVTDPHAGYHFEPGVGWVKNEEKSGGKAVTHAAGFMGMVRSGTHLSVGEQGPEDVFVSVRPFVLPRLPGSSRAISSPGMEPSGATVIHVYLDGKEISAQTVKRIAKETYRGRQL